MAARPRQRHETSDVPCVLHLVARPHPGEPSTIARDLVSGGDLRLDGSAARVVELFDPRPGVAVVDLSLSERDVPEIASLLHVTEEIHLHGVHPRVAIECLPSVRQAVLAGIALVVHGPTPKLALVTEAHPERSWPGPVRCDEVAAKSLEQSPNTDTRWTIDPEAPAVLPRACGAIPLVTEDGRYLAAVCLGPNIDEARYAQLRLDVESLSRAEVRIEAYVDAEVPSIDRAARRRASQAMIVGPQDADAPSRAFLEALLQGLPIAMMSERGPEPVPGVTYLGAYDDTDRAIAAVRSWAGLWADGEAPPVGLAARRAWVEHHRLR